MSALSVLVDGEDREVSFYKLGLSVPHIGVKKVNGSGFSEQIL